MKKIILISTILIFIISSAFSQSSLKIYSDIEDEKSHIKVFLNGEVNDANYWDEVIIEDLLPGKYEMIVSFNSDTISDYVKKIKIKKNTKVVYRVVLKKEFGKEAGKMGRSLGRTLNKTGDDDKEGLIQWYRLVNETKK